MRKQARFLVFILCIALLLTATSCKNQEDMGGAQSLSKQEEALARYQLACEKLRNAPDLTVVSDFVCNRTVGGEVYSEKLTETAAYYAVGTADAAAVVKQQVAFGPYDTEYNEFYYHGAAYCQIGDTVFRGDMKETSFLKRQIPALPVTASLYDGVDVATADNTVITFSAPKSLESWVTGYNGAAVQDATATVTLDKNGDLLHSTYKAQYICGQTVYDLEVTVSVKPEGDQSLLEDLAGLPAKCPTLTYFEAPRKILQVVGDVYTAAAMSAKYTESVYSAAFARSRTQTSYFDIFGTDADFMARSSYEVVNTDYSNTPTSTAEVVIFRDGVCTSSVNGAEPTVREGILAETMRTYCEDAVLAALFTPNHIKNAKLTEKNGQLRIDFTGNTAFADYVCSNIYAIFNANLDTYAQSYTTPKAGGYLCIDKATGLPTAVGVTLERIHVAGEVSYPLTYQLDQTMQLSSNQAYENITGQPEPAPTEPEANP